MLGRLRNAVAATIPVALKSPIKRALGLPLTQLNADWSILAPIGPLPRQHVVLDIGAHHGWFFHCWQDWCPAAQVYAFEPYPKSFETMLALYGSDSRVKLFPQGVGSVVGHLDLNILEQSDVSNSFLQPEQATWRDVDYQYGGVSHTSVPVTTIDHVASEEQLNNIYLLKIDVQGFELEVLKGAEATLPTIDHIFVESGIRNLYQNSPRFTDVFEYLTERGFHLMTMRSWHRGNHVLMETDMLFRRDELAPPVESAIERVYV